MAQQHSNHKGKTSASGHSEEGLLEAEARGFYCPYTNSDKCALLTKGWQPQELCLALGCEQMEQVSRNKKNPK